MNVLVLGSGGREHAIYEKLKESNQIDNLYIAPGNAGIEDTFRVKIPANHFAELAEFAKSKDIKMIVVGPEDPLAGGIVDYFQEFFGDEILVIGPDVEGAKLESSKVFAQKFMETVGIPVGRSIVIDSTINLDDLFSSFVLVLTHDWKKPLVVKVDGLAAGKGVSIHRTPEEAREKIHKIFYEEEFGSAGEQILLQEFLEGTEASLFALCNGHDVIFLPTARDYKRAFNDNQGPNTGGMGSFSPGDALNEGHLEFIKSRIVEPVLGFFRYRGFLYLGLMVHSEKPDDISMIEFNCRLGDPETQCVLRLMEPDLFPYLLWTVNKEENVPRLRKKGYDVVPQKSGGVVNVVIAAKGYPGKYEKGIPLNLDIDLPEGVQLIHAGTERQGDRVVSTGGRIFNVVAYGKNIAEARQLAYRTVDLLKEKNDFSRLHVRTDIASDI
ncbi:MAG: phosphoribosylamine--glycine ligase [Candidatus Hydrogenedentota bacterium]|nr:MAG: phosphoribosylamine--glycine ligase [Candidatus Hydrogenedentota bacterium]